MFRIPIVGKVSGARGNQDSPLGRHNVGQLASCKLAARGLAQLFVYPAEEEWSRQGGAGRTYLAYH